MPANTYRSLSRPMTGSWRLVPSPLRRYGVPAPLRNATATVWSMTPLWSSIVINTP